jgi:ferritin
VNLRITVNLIVGDIKLEISKELTDAINDQINYELYSGYIYLSMASWFEEQNLDGMAHWMKIQAGEEYEHAMRFWEHVIDRGGRVILKEIEAPKTEWSSPHEAWSDAYEHELKVTARIIKIGEVATNLGDKSAEPMLAWFYNEQVEEEEQTMKVRDLLKRIGDQVGALYQLDAKLGTRGK